MKPKLFLHIGMPRTGTTSIQKCLSEHLDGHPEYEILYLKEGRDSEGFGHHCLPALIQDDKEKIVDELTQEYQAAKLNNNIKSCIISSEGFSQMLENKSSLAKFLEFYQLLSNYFNVTLLICVRNPNESIKSMYKHQAVFNGYQKSGLEYLTDYLHDFHIFIESLTEIVKAGMPIKFFNYHSLVGKDLVTVMTGGLVRGEIGKSTPSPSDNASLLMTAYENFNIDLPIHFRNALIFSPTLIPYIDNFITSSFIIPDEQRMYGDVSNFYYERRLFEEKAKIHLQSLNDIIHQSDAEQLIGLNQISQLIQNHLHDINYSWFLDNYKNYLTLVDLKNEMALLQWTDAIFLRVTSIVGDEYLDFRDALKNRIQIIIDSFNS